MYTHHVQKTPLHARISMQIHPSYEIIVIVIIVIDSSFIALIMSTRHTNLVRHNCAGAGKENVYIKICMRGRRRRRRAARGLC